MSADRHCKSELIKKLSERVVPAMCPQLHSSAHLSVNRSLTSESSQRVSQQALCVYHSHTTANGFARAQARTSINEEPLRVGTDSLKPRGSRQRGCDLLPELKERVTGHSLKDQNAGASGVPHALPICDGDLCSTNNKAIRVLSASAANLVHTACMHALP